MLQEDCVMDEKPRPFLSIPERLTNWYRNRQAEIELVEDVVEIVEPKLRNVRGYRQQLRSPLQICQQHCKAMVAQLPGPIHLKRADYYADPIIKAAFVGSEKIEDLLASPEANVPVQNPTAERFALLTMTRTEKKIFGPKRQGAMIVADAAMQTVTFTDHKIVGLATTLESSRNKLARLSMEVVAEAAARELAARKSHLADLRRQREKLQAMSRMFGGGSRARSVFGAYNLEEQEKLQKVRALLEETEKELAAVREGVEEPKDWLVILANYLAAPEKIMHGKIISLRLDWKNVLTSDPEEQANTITLAQLSLTDELQRDAVLVSYGEGKGCVVK
jgi:hypothetical protein